MQTKLRHMLGYTEALLFYEKQSKIRGLVTAFDCAPYKRKVWLLVARD